MTRSLLGNLDNGNLPWWVRKGVSCLVNKPLCNNGSGLACSRLAGSQRVGQCWELGELQRDSVLCACPRLNYKV